MALVLSIKVKYSGHMVILGSKMAIFAYKEMHYNGMNNFSFFFFLNKKERKLLLRRW